MIGSPRLPAAGLLAGLALTIMSASGVAQQARLGTIAFPTSASGPAQDAFVRGVLYLHSFEYESAAQSFRSAQEADPGFAMAYWGEALSHTHPVWNQQNLTTAREVLTRLGPTPAARVAKAPTARERGYLAAVEALYGEGSKPRRDTLFAAAMEQLARDYPDDDEARVFHAVALLGLNQGVRSVPDYMRAGAIALEVLERNPDHPGAAHFVIHAFDDPEHAPLGLRAAFRYIDIAPDAGHAQHMTTHIFLAMGMWDQVVSQNDVASSISQWQSGHYVSWYAYGLLQQGRWREAQAVLEKAHGDWTRAGSRRYLPGMVADQVFLTGQWDHPALGLELGAGDLAGSGRATREFTQGWARIQQGDVAGAVEHLGRLRVMARQPAGMTPNDRALPGIFAHQLDAAQQAAIGNTVRAVELVLEATALEDALPVEFGPPQIVKPTHEQAGDLLLAVGAFAEAQREYQRALALGPGRSTSLLGLARAAERAGDTAAAKRAWAALRTNWHAADPGIPSLGEVRSKAGSW